MGEKDPGTIVIGAGLTGLAAAVELRRAGHRVLVLEAGGRAGGAVCTDAADGFLAERGPNTLMVNDPQVGEFLRVNGLEGEMVAPRAARRFIVRGGKPLALPSGPAGAVTTPVFSLAGKLRILAEPFIPRGTVDDESLADLVRRRLGPEMLAYAIEPFVAGIYAGNPEKLSARHAFPKLWNLERRHGSFIRGALRLRRSGPPQRMVSFRNGMRALPDALAASLGADLRLGAHVEEIVRGDDGRWRVTWREGGGASSDAGAPKLVCAVPAFAVPPLPWPGALRDGLGILDEIEYPPVTVVVHGFRRADVAHPLDGFGMLVPAAERRRILGTLFTSSLFPGRAPEGCVLLTTFVGGARQPRLAELGDDALDQDVCSDLRELLGLDGPPVFRRIYRWPRAIPQYNTGYGRILSALESLEAAWPGLHLAGNYRGGIAAGQCILNGMQLAARIAGAPTSTEP